MIHNYRLLPLRCELISRCSGFNFANNMNFNENLQYEVFPISVAVQDFYERQLANSGLK